MKRKKLPKRININGQEIYSIRVGHEFYSFQEYVVPTFWNTPFKYDWKNHIEWGIRAFYPKDGKEGSRKNTFRSFCDYSPDIQRLIEYKGIKMIEL